MNLRSFSEIEAMAAQSVGGLQQLEQQMLKPLSASKIKKIPSEKWLSELTRSVFQAGFNWQVVDNKWPGFEAVFGGFNLHFCAYMSDEKLEECMGDARIIRNLMKVKTIRHNATFLLELENEFGTVGEYFSTWKYQHFCENIAYLAQQGQRLGGKTSQLAMRRLGVDSLILTNDVIAALMRERVIDKVPSSKKGQKAVQEAINIWVEDSGRSMNEISKILAFSVG